MDATERECFILLFRHKGRKNALSSRDIDRMLHLHTPGCRGDNGAKVRTIIQSLRLSGAPICSSPQSPSGYWWASSIEDLEDTCGRLRHRIQEQSETLVALERTLRKLKEEVE